MRKLFSALVLVLFVGGTAVAQPAKGGAKEAAGAGKVKVYDFSGDTIEGDLVKPEGSTVDARDFAKQSSLIRIRKDFIPEIIKSAEDL
ncbi:MAG: adventurous gliding motility protein CglF [Kofleriaceae bacterium]